MSDQINPALENSPELKAAEKARKDAELAEKARLANVAHVLSTPQGRAFVWDLIERCGVYAISAVIRADDPNGFVTHFNEGRRSVGLKLVSDVHLAKPDAYQEMRAESIKRKGERK